MEELKLVLETIKTISGDASTVAIWWVVLHYVIGFLEVMAICGSMVGGIYIIARACQNANEWAESARTISKAFGGRGGYMRFNEDEKAFEKAIQAAQNKKP